LLKYITKPHGGETLLSSIVEKAHDLGQALSESDEAVVLHAAEMNMEQDLEAQALIKDFQARQKNMQEAEQAKKEVSDEDWNEFTRVQEKMKENKALQAYFGAMQMFQKLIQDVNAEINKVLTGGASCPPSECDDCSLDCKQ
jgi:cell fate (sporulation/competence/biofilm development) regulator YlbF (YheA/YmcA/DUF963 family)